MASFTEFNLLLFSALITICEYDISVINEDA